VIAPDAAKRGASQASGPRFFVRTAALLIAAISALLILASSALGANVLNQSLAAAQSLIPPTVTSISPAQGKQEGGTPVKIKGTGFVSGAKVYIGSKAASVAFVSETELTATTSEGFGKDEVVVSDEKGVSSSGPDFTYVAPPVVTSITPAEGSTAGGAAVKIKGTGFMKGSSVTIGKAARSVEIISEAEIKAVTPAFCDARRAVHLESGLFFRFIQAGYVEPWKPELARRHRGDRAAVAGVCRLRCAGGPCARR
jgi:hypothetical protein